MQERVQKILARAGIASRRQAEIMIQQGRVSLNGTPCVLGDTADAAADEITVDGVPVGTPPEKVYLMLHKPRGFLTTVSDPRGRRTVMELIDCPERVYPVGRLDLDSEGLLLLTNDGALTNKLIHPSHEIEKTYLVWLDQAEPEKLRAMGWPMDIDGYRIKPARVELLWQKNGQAQIRIVIHEGRNRQIRKMAETCGMHVTRLRRIGEGPLTLGDLKRGAWRHLTVDEVAALQNL